MKTRTVKLGDVRITVPADLPLAERIPVLEAAFKRVQNTDHWKGPINTIVTVRDAADLADITESVEFFTATEATAVELGAGLYRIVAPGYWAGPAN